MAIKMVRYNGSNLSFNNCSPATNLVKGKVYEVIFVEPVSCAQSNYILKGVEGSFSSTWFEDVTKKGNLYLAVGFSMPEVGKEYDCLRICDHDEQNDKLLRGCVTTMVTATRKLGGNIYEVRTLNSTYLVHVLHA